jgi:hypothetical protein
MPDDENKPDVEVVNDPEPESPDTPSDVTVDLNTKPSQKPDDKPKEDKPSLDFSKLNNTIAYQTRKLEQALRELNEVKSTLSRPKEVVKDINDPDYDEEAERIAQTNWQKGVKKVVEKDIETKVEELLRKREEARAEEARKVATTAELEKSKSRVIERYPAILEAGSDEERMYREVINEDTSLLQNVHGPEIAMYRMEEKMRAQGRIPASSKPIVDREASRLARAGASNVTGRQASNPGKITLTREQKEFCDHYKIPYDQYAKNLKADAGLGGVEV